MYLTVETSRSQERLVQNVGAVSCSKYYDTAIRTKAVHLGQQLVERILSFVVRTHAWVLATGTTHCVNLVNEYYTWRLLLRLLEQIPHTACAYADEHLHKVGTRH